MAGSILRKLGKIVLKPNPALSNIDHPSYFEARASVGGGAWHLIDHLRDGERGECQSMVRLIRALLYLTGAVANPGEAAVSVVYADPSSAASGEKALLDMEADSRFSAAKDIIDSGGLHAFERVAKVSGTDEKQWAVLLGVVAGAGEKVPQTRGLNFYEAALRLDAEGRVAFYAGGFSQPFASIDAILRTHVALAWVADAPPPPPGGEQQKIIRSIVQGYRDFNRVKP